MQISRHWRLNAQRYRLQGFRNENGELSLQARPTLRHRDVTDHHTPMEIEVENKQPKTQAVTFIT